MYTLAPDEKTSSVMIYAQNALVHGEVVTKQNVRVSIWLRAAGFPQYLHLLKSQVLIFNSVPLKSLAYPELYFPAAQVIGFHLAPPASEPLDYDESEVNRMMTPVAVLLGTFIVRGNIRISTQTDIGSSLEVMRSPWMSVYDAEVTNPYLPQMGALRVPMLLVSPTQVSFAL